MTDEMLLATPDWKTLTDIELARAVTLAKKRGRQTAELIFAYSQEHQRPYLVQRLANFDMYLVHCVRSAPDSKRLIEEWGYKNAVESCSDPRLAWFCVIYQRTRWHLLKKGKSPRVSTLLLRKVRDRQFEKLTEAQYYYSMQVAAIHQYGGSVHDPIFEPQIKKLHSQFMTQLDYAMLAVMTLNVATEEWLAECRG
jgi:hypothetical protein